jgi:hypothetical protein
MGEADMKLYGKEVAKEIIKCRHDEFIFKKSGVFPKDDRPSSDPEFDACNWRFACELGGQDGQKLRKKPGLPIPFNKNVLAAFFLHGRGWYVRDFFGAWDDGPYDAAFVKIDHLERGEVKEVVTGAFRALRDAESIVGKFDDTLARMALEIDDAFWNAAPSKRTAEMLEALRIAHKRADEAESVWIKKMVNQLLTVATLPIVDSHPVAQVQTVEALTVQHITSAAPLTTVVHSTKTRRDTLTPVIELAQSQCRTSTDTAEVWGVLLVLAERKTAPLIGATEDGLQYLKDGTAANFTRNSLRLRLARQAPITAAKRR